MPAAGAVWHMRRSVSVAQAKSSMLELVVAEVRRGRRGFKGGCLSRKRRVTVDRVQPLENVYYVVSTVNQSGKRAY